MTFHNASKSEIFLSMISLWWAFVLCFNRTMFDDLPTIYVGIAEVAGQSVWALVFIFSASIKVIGIIGNYGLLRIYGLILSTMLYALITAGYIWSDAWFHTGTGVYFSLTVLAFWRLREVRILYAR